MKSRAWKSDAKVLESRCLLKSSERERWAPLEMNSRSITLVKDGYCFSETPWKMRFRKKRVYCSYRYSSAWREVKADSLGRNLEARTEAEAVELCCLMVFLLLTGPICFLTLSRTTCTEVIPPTVSRALPQQHKLKNCPTGLSTETSGRGIFSVEDVSPPSIALAYVKLI